MFGLPLSWIIAGAGIAALAGYIGLLKLKAKLANKRAVIATQERDNARVEQRTTQTAQDAEHAYQAAHDTALQDTTPKREQKADKDVGSGGSGGPDQSATANKLNSLFPVLLLCLVLVGCASPATLVASNPAAQVVIPAADSLEPVTFFVRDGNYCLDDAAAAALGRNVKKLKARTAGLEAALRSLGAEVK
ncbi:hypothetical protein [Mariprofundus ferrooxydans]|uniref:Uncharacterized protein n=1 Tax=Mariprofundus ferrooxydans PV-1 TaxID=314345 RepID=Q0EWC8_9PROT|nr:hypothetical protein [Mariprofundus ferrooxydans]EAU53543.1 hypothetical protein SPV1_02858 [Mariprofundus ferrooxydans PV-1]KON47008.1 hypothetical protein AL013_10475 [Mariprofundus ferrooxydans]